MQPADIGRLVTVADPQVSPDGRLVAFVVTRVDLEANRYRSAVWLAAVDGSVPPYRFTGGEGGESAPRWAPDGRWLAYVARTDGGSALRVAPVGPPGEVVTVCTRKEAIEAPAWAPDGRSIAFASREPVWDGDDDARRPPRRIDRLVTRVDDEGFVVDRPRGVSVVPVDGSAPPRLVAGGPFEHGDPVWSPDGRHLAVAVARHPDWDLDLAVDVYRVPVDGGEPEPLTERGLAWSLPAWSPDGSRIAALVADENEGRFARLALLDVGSGEVTWPTAGLDREHRPFPGARAPVWHGDALLFSVEDHGEVPVLRVPADGSAAPEALVGGRFVTAFGAAGGTVAFVVSTPTALPELYVRDAAGERRLTDLGAAFHAACPARPAEPLRVPSPAGDGDVDAWLVLPDPGTAGPDGRFPVLLSVHGGPATQYGNRWFDEFQLWAGAGYAVVYCNPHGSTGRTEAWMRAIRAPEAPLDPGTGWGGIDADDVLAVLDAALRRHPELDGDRVGVLGGSYGGFMTSWLVGHTDRFAAACSERAANNLLSLDWSSDAAGLFRTVFGVSPLDEPAAYLRMSPVTYVRDIATPLLILHAENDLRCHVEQADQMFVALRQLGKEVEYHRFPGESHEMSRTGSPVHRVQRAELILEFFGRHLKGVG